MDLFSELISIVAELNQAGISHALAGGLAYSLYVEARATEDIDLVIRPEDWPKVCAVLQPLGYRQLAMPMKFPDARINRLTKVDKGQFLVVDFILADVKPLSEVWGHLHEIPLRGSVVRVVNPQALIEMKKLRLSAKDLSDIAGLERMLDEEGGAK